MSKSSSPAPADVVFRPPAKLGYYMPPEWHPHESTWLAWPSDRSNWPGRLVQVQEIFLRIITCLAPSERVDLLVQDAEAAEKIRRKVGKDQLLSPSLVFHEIKTADVWIRDYGPNFLIRRRGRNTDLALNHWDFNSWGNKYSELEKDAEVPEKLLPLLKVPCFRPGLVVEGGAIDVNGQGVCLTTEQCLLNPNRNPGLSREQIEQYLRDYLGVHQILWLGGGIAGDDTDGHVDEVARFVGPRTIVCALEDNPADENYGPLQDNYQRLRLARDPKGHPFQVVPLPMPEPLETSQGRLPASYANFYIGNRVVLVPTFGHPSAQRGLEILQSLFPDRKVIGIPCRPLVWGMGHLHCVTQQQPLTSGPKATATANSIYY